MNAPLRHSLVAATVIATSTVVEKAASANQDQLQVLDSLFPKADQPMSKLAALSRILATADLVADEE